MATVYLLSIIYPLSFHLYHLQRSLFFYGGCFCVYVSFCASYDFLTCNKGDIYSKTCLKQPLKRRPKLVFKTDYRLMQVERGAFCNTFDLH